MSLDSRSDSKVPVDPVQLTALLARLADRLDAAHDRLGRLGEIGNASAGQIDVLIRHLTSPDAGLEAVEQAGEFAAKLDALDARIMELSESVTRLNRTQFKANAVSETQAQRTADAIALLQGLTERRETAERDAAFAEAEAIESIRAGTRAEVAANLLPSIDGIENAIVSGRALVARHAADHAGAPHHGLLWKLMHPGEAAREGAASDLEAIEGWIEGLELVRERFVALLAAEGIRTIPALGESFDPSVHVAVAVRTGSGVPGTVVEVVRAGYSRGETVLRFAEVVVERPAP